MNPAIVVAGLSLLATGVMALATLLGQRGKNSIDAQTGLTAGQLAFINTLSEREKRLQTQLDLQQQELFKLQSQVLTLQATCRAAGIPIPPFP